MGYRVFPIVLAAAQAAAQEVVPPGVEIGEIAIFRMAGGEYELRIGQNGDWFFVSGPISFNPRGPMGTSGLYWRNVAAQAGVPNAQLIVVYGHDDNQQLNPSVR